MKNQKRGKKRGLDGRKIAENCVGTKKLIVQLIASFQDGMEGNQASRCAQTLIMRNKVIHTGQR